MPNTALDLENGKKLFLIGLDEMQKGRFPESEVAFLDSLKFVPRRVSTLTNLSAVRIKLQKYELAIEAADQAIDLEKDNPEAWSNRGTAFFHLNLRSEALASLDKAIKLNCDYPEGYYNRGKILNELDQLDLAVWNFDRAIELRPDYPEAYSCRGIALRYLGADSKAEESYRRAIELDPRYPDGHNNFGHFLLAQNRFSEGWSEYEFRGMTTSPLNLVQIPKDQVWGGHLSKGQKLLIHAEQGIGDEIIFGSLLDCLEREFLDGDIFVTADKRLIPIYKRSFNRVEFLDKEIPVRAENYDFQLNIGSLGRFFLKEKNDFTKNNYPFLKHNEILTKKLRERVSNDGRLVCGLAWKSIRADDYLGEKKSITFDAMLPFLSSPDLKFVNLQYGDMSAEISKLREQHGIEIHQFSDIDNFHDIDSLLSLIAACDFIVTVTNVTAHLAGGIGQKTFQLCPRGRGKVWYWENIDDDHNSLWYPSVKILEQSKAGDWTETINGLSSELEIIRTQGNQ